jgi:hypothetical protein
MFGAWQQPGMPQLPSAQPSNAGQMPQQAQAMNPWGQQAPAPAAAPAPAPSPTAMSAFSTPYSASLGGMPMGSMPMGMGGAGQQASMASMMNPAMQALYQVRLCAPDDCLLRLRLVSDPCTAS